ncbi:GDT1 family protein [Trichonephila clavipes]|nr:GDT1 family protein [Trichonephila clavipes]
MNCQTKLRINHLTAVKSVAILESNANLNFYTWKKNTLYKQIAGAKFSLSLNRIVTMLKRNDLVRIFFLASSLSWRTAVLADDLTIYPDALISTETSLVVGGNGTLPSFVSGVLSAFTVTAVSEIGDKTFFIALVLALAHSPAVVYGGALSALALMTVLSASLGLVFSYLSALWVHYLSALLFLLFGLKMLREASWEVWMMTKSIVSVAYNRYHTLRHRIQEALDVSLRLFASLFLLRLPKPPQHVEDIRHWEA